MTNATRGRVVPAGDGKHLDMGAPAESMDDDERDTLRERYRWEVVGPNPL